MKVTTKTFVLTALLDKARNVLPRTSVQQVLTNYLVEADERGLRVVATDLDLSVIASSSVATCAEPGRVLLPGKMLDDLVKSAAEDDLHLTVADGNATIEAGKARWSLKAGDDSAYPTLIDPEGLDTTEVDRAAFVAALQRVYKAASGEAHRVNLAMVDVAQGRFRASDGVRFQQVETDFDLTMSLPVGAVKDLLALLKATEAATFRVGQTDDDLVFLVNDDVFGVSKLTVEFPNVEDILLRPALTNGLEMWVDRDDLLAAIKRVRVTADPEVGGVRWDLDHDRLTVRCADRYGNVAEETLMVRWNHGARTVAFQHTHLVDLLSSATSRSLRLWLGEDTKTRKCPLLLRDEEARSLSILNQILADFVG